MRCCARIVLLSIGILLSGCASVVVSPTEKITSDKLPLVFGAQEKMRWEVMQLPGKLRTAFRLTHKENRQALHTESGASISMLRQKLRIAPQQLGLIQFEWQVSNLIEGADMTQRDAEDSPVRVVLAFDGDRSRFSPRNAMLSELTRSITGEEMPYAVLMYVWSNDLPVGTVIINPRTDRIRKIVVESGHERLGRWLRYDRDVRADFIQAFEESPGMLQSLAIMTDTDNTRGKTQAWYGEIRLNSAEPSR